MLPVVLLSELNEGRRAMRGKCGTPTPNGAGNDTTSEPLNFQVAHVHLQDWQACERHFNGSKAYQIYGVVLQKLTKASHKLALQASEQRLGDRFVPCVHACAR